jgi:hypothetical protein
MSRCQSRDAAVDHAAACVRAVLTGSASPTLPEAMAALRSAVLADDEAVYTASRSNSFVTVAGEVKQLSAKDGVQLEADPIRQVLELRHGDTLEALHDAAAGRLPLPLDARADSLLTLSYVLTAAQGHSAQLRQLEICAAACSIITEALSNHELRETNGDPATVLWMAFSSLFCLLGSRNPWEWEGCAAVEGDVTPVPSASLASADSACSHVSRVVLAALVEHGLWASLWTRYVAQASSSTRLGTLEALVGRLALKLLWTLSIGFSSAALSLDAKDESDLGQHAQLISVASGNDLSEKYDGCLQVLMRLLSKPALAAYAACAAQALLLHYSFALRLSVTYRDLRLPSLTTAAEQFRAMVEQLLAAVSRWHDVAAAEARAIGFVKPDDRSLREATCFTVLLCTLAHCANDREPGTLFNVWAVASSKCSFTLQTLLASPLFSVLLSTGLLRLHQALLAVLQRSEAVPACVEMYSQDVVAASVLVTPNVLYADSRETMSKASAIRVCASCHQDDPGSPGRRRRSFLSVVAATADEGRPVEVLSMQRAESDLKERPTTMIFGSEGADPIELTPTLEKSDHRLEVAGVALGAQLNPTPVTTERMCFRAEAQLSVFAKPAPQAAAVISSVATRATDVEVWLQQAAGGHPPPRNAFERRRAAAKGRLSVPAAPPRYQGFVRTVHVTGPQLVEHNHLSNMTTNLSGVNTTDCGASPPPKDPSASGPTGAESLPRSTASEDILEELTEAHSTALAGKDGEISFLNQRIAELERTCGAETERCAVVEQQRDQLLQAATDLRSEVTFCHDNVITPLRAEVSRLRRHLGEREAALGAAVRAGQRLTFENAELLRLLGDAQSLAEELSAAVHACMDQPCSA